MKTVSKILFLAMFIALSVIAYADEVGNGGGSFVCVNENDEILSAENQDLWEAINVWGLNISTSNLEEQSLSYHVISRIQDINTKFYQRVRLELDDVFQRREILPLAISELEPPVLRKDTCENGVPKFVQAAVYFESGRLIYNQRIWNAYSTLHKATQNVHEAIARIFRVYYDEKTTDRARRLVGLLFSSISQKALENFIPAYRFNPSSRFSYDEKIEDLNKRFKEGSRLLVEPYEPDRGLFGSYEQRVVTRKCVNFTVWRDYTPKKVELTSSTYEFTYEPIIGLVVDFMKKPRGLRYKFYSRTHTGGRHGVEHPVYESSVGNVDSVITGMSEENGDWILKLSTERNRQPGEPEVDYTIIFCPDLNNSITH